VHNITRINVVPPQELHNKFLVAELHEISRVYGLVRKAQARKINKYNFHDKLKVPAEYTLGTGHCLHFYNKLAFITERYYALCKEAKDRGFKVNPIERSSLIEGINPWWFGEYQVTEDALAINRERLAERSVNFK